MYILARETSAPVLAGLAEGLAAVPGADASGRLVTLLGHEDPVVRRAAARSLSARGGDDAARLAELAADPDLDLRLIVLPTLRDPEALARGLEAESPAEAALALATLARVRGRAAVLVEVMNRIAASPEASARRAALAGAWLAAR
jgi:hypothetical protein